MGNIDRQRIAAVRTLQALGYTFDGIKWMPPTCHPLWAETDELYRLLVGRADYLISHPVGLRAMGEFSNIARALEAYEAKRWPNGKEPDGKG
jgi:hypothetical protein